MAWLQMMSARRGAVFLLAASVVLALPRAGAGDDGALGVPGVRGGVVTTSEPLAAEVGARVLRAGGNAIDAAAAVQFVLNVAEPQSSGVGGGGFMMIHLAKRGRTLIVDSRETAPAAATPDMFKGASFPVRSTSGYAVGVPGTVLGVAMALERFGTLSLAETLEPAIALAARGVRVSSRLEKMIANSRLDNEPGNPAYDLARDVFRPQGVGLVEGDLLVQPALAKTFRLIAENGVDAFYGGDVAQAIVEAQKATRAENPGGIGRMTLADLAAYEVAIREPVEGRYRDYRIVSMPPPSSGGLTVIQILKLIERFPIGDAKQGFAFGAANTLHVMIEAMRLAFADRALWMGDDDFVSVPSRGLIDDEYVATRSALIKLDARLGEVNAGDPLPFDPEIKEKLLKVAVSPASDTEGLNTTHFTIVDQHGNIVTYTSTIESAWGTGLMVPGFGFMLNNELTDFNAEPRSRSQPESFNPGANDVAAGKRPRSSMAPTIIFKGREAVAAFGSPGGSTIIDTVTNIAVNLVDHEMVVQEAVDAPRFAQTSANGTVRLEHGFAEEVLERLKARGHEFKDPAAIGSVQAIVVEHGRHFGAADKRRIGGVVSLRRKDIGSSGEARPRLEETK